MGSKWKVLVYMAADNSLYKAAESSLREICSVLSERIEVLVQFDGPRADQASRYVCGGGRKHLIWVAPEGYTGDRRQRLTDFLTAALDHHVQDKRYFLVLWGHGAGLDHVYLYKDPGDHSGARPSVPEPSPGDNGVAPQASLRDLGDLEGYLQNLEEILNGENANRYVKDIELGAVLKAFSNKTGRKIDLLGLDACLMGMAEICHEIRDSTSIMVASDETIPKGSWPYDLILGDLARHPGIDARTLSAVIVSRFEERYTTEGDHTRLELSSLDLAACDDLAEAMKELVAALDAVVEDGSSRLKVLRARGQAQNPDEPTYIDLAVFCRELIQAFPSGSPVSASSKETLSVLFGKPYVIYHRDSNIERWEGACGLCCYFPDKPVSEVFLVQLEERVGLNLYHPLQEDVPADDRKFPPHSGKFPPHSKKGELQIKSWEILWNHYVALQFNKATGWADFVKRFLDLMNRVVVATS